MNATETSLSDDDLQLYLSAVLLRTWQRYNNLQTGTPILITYSFLLFASKRVHLANVCDFLFIRNKRPCNEYFDTTQKRKFTLT